MQSKEESKVKNKRGVIMLCKYIKGRLGNQLFQYAALRAFQEKYFPEESLVLSFQKVEKKAKKEGFSEINSLDHFHTKYKIANINLSMKQIALITILSANLFVSKKINPKSYTKNRDRIERKFQKKLLKNNIVWKTSGYSEFDFSLINKKKDILFYGYFESPKYFDDIKDMIREELTPKQKIIPKNMKLLNEIQKENSVCVSIRRGDFIENEKYRKEHFICDEAYFEKAKKEMEKQVKNPKYIIFSDDIKWVKENMNFPAGSLYEDGNDPVWEKLRLMYHCKHFIISNSSFSWWAQYLSKNENKVVIAPKAWNLKNDNRDIYEDDFILI